MGKGYWVDLFDERQQKEIGFARIYAENFNHGTDGHNAKLIIARMAELFDQIELVVGNSTGESALALTIIDTLRKKD